MFDRLRRLLDRLAQLVNVEPRWADFGDVEVPDIGDRPARD